MDDLQSDRLIIACRVPMWGRVVLTHQLFGLSWREHWAPGLLGATRNRVVARWFRVPVCSDPHEQGPWLGDYHVGLPEDCGQELLAERWLSR